MHQGHNIPWNVIATNFQFVEYDERFTPPFTGLLGQRRSGATKEVKHFVDKFISAIRAFSETERKKYPATFTPIFTGNVFSDELRNKYPEYLNPTNQRFQYWTSPHISAGGLADVIKVLLYENEMDTLLMLAQHPAVRIAALHNVHWGYHFGFSRVKESALQAYLFFNFAEATGILENGKYTCMPGYHQLITELTAPGDFPAQTIPHVKFWERHSTTTHKETGSSKVVHNDYKALQEYLKTLFTLMYRYDVLTQECGLNPEWEKEFWFCYLTRITF